MKRIFYLMLFSLLIIISCSREYCGFRYISKEILETRAKMSYSSIRNKTYKAEYGAIVISQQDSTKRMGSMYFFAEQFLVSTNGLNDTLFFINDNNNNVLYLFDSKKKAPIVIAIYCSDLYSHTEIIVDGNGLLRKRVAHELEIKGFNTKYYYVNQAVYHEIALGEKKPIFLEKAFIDRYMAMQQMELPNTYLLISEFRYNADIRPYLIQVVFTRM